MGQMDGYMSGYPDGFVPPDVACYGKRYIKKWQASVKKYQTYDFWRQMFYTAAITRFKWDNLPKGIDSRYLEVMLCGYGAFAATRRGPSDLLPFWCGRMTPIGNRDLYNNPNQINIISPNGVVQRRHANWWINKRGSNGHKEVRQLMPADAVVCWDNLPRLPLINIIDIQASRLAEMDITVDQHTRAMRVPYIIPVYEGGEKNAKAMYNRIDSGDPAIYYYGQGPNTLPVQILQTMSSSSYAGDKLLNDELKIVSSMYTALGIDNNAAAEKKERVQTAETLANNEQFLLQRESYNRPRQEFLRLCQETLGGEWLDTTVKWAIPHNIEDAPDLGASGISDPYSAPTSTGAAPKPSEVIL